MTDNAGVQPLARTLHVLVTGEQVPPTASPVHLEMDFRRRASSSRLRGRAGVLCRPDGAALIRAVYERYLAMPELPAGAIIPNPNSRHRSRRRNRSAVALPRWVAAAAAVAIIGGALIVWSLGGASGEASGSTSRASWLTVGVRWIRRARSWRSDSASVPAPLWKREKMFRRRRLPLLPVRVLRSVQPAVIVQLPTLAIPLVEAILRSRSRAVVDHTARNTDCAPAGSERRSPRGRTSR
jgi:hypothetical protein